MDKYIRIDADLKKRLKILSAKTDTSIKSLAEKYIQQGLKKEEEELLKEWKGLNTRLNKVCKKFSGG